MIAKHLKGCDVEKCLKYVLSKPDAVILDGIVNGSIVESLTRQFHLYNQANSKAKYVVHHAILSTTADEPLNNELWSKLAQDYLSQMDYTQVPYLVVRHHDTKHHHVHIVAGRIRVDGSCVSSRWDKIRSLKVASLLEQKYNLSPLVRYRRNYSYQPLDSEKETYTYLQTVIDRQFGQEQSIIEFLRSLSQAQITVSLRKKRAIYYHYLDHCFSSSQLGRDYTWNGLVKRGLSDATINPTDLEQFQPQLNSLVQSEKLNFIAPIVKEVFERFAKERVLIGQLYTISNWKKQYRLLRNEDGSTIYQANLYGNSRWDVLMPSRITEQDVQRFQLIQKQLKEQQYERKRSPNLTYSSKSL